MRGRIGIYTDQELDTETGLYNYDARMYDPLIGRFISPDSMVPDLYDPQSLNRYSYCRNNPLIYTDPTGHYDDGDNNGDTADFGDPEDDGQDSNGYGEADRGEGFGGTITYQNDDPSKPDIDPSELTNDTRKMVEDVVQDTDLSININSGYRKDSTTRHGTGQAVDINRVEDKRVNDPDNLDNVKKVQDAFNAHPNIRENFGPALNTKTLEDGTRVDKTTNMADSHKDHVHVSGQK